MRKRCWILLAGALLMLSGCTAASEAAVGREDTPQVTETIETDIHQTDETGTNAAKVDDNKVLIAYFTWADNRGVKNVPIHRPLEMLKSDFSKNVNDYQDEVSSV